MDVTRENFAEIYPELKEKISTASFICFDEEMSGITNPEFSLRNRKEDDPDARYLKMVPVASRYSIIQIGICLFHKVGDNFEASPYNFYIFPNMGPDIILSTSSIDFLRKNGMNFQTWIMRGLPFVNEQGETSLAKKFLQTETSVKKEMMNLSKQSDLEYMKKQEENFSIFMTDETAVEFLFEFSNSYLRRAVYMYLDFHYEGKIEILKMKDQRVCVKKIPIGGNEEIKKKLEEVSRVNFETGMGFRLVFNDLVKAKKPLIGHNCMFDILFMMRWFDRPLSQNLTEFKLHLNELFPILLDTKYIASSGVLGRVYENTTLKELHDTLCKESESVADVPQSLINASKVTFAAGFDGYAAGEQFHDAGWDAYSTGLVFHREMLSLGGEIEEVISKAGGKMFMMQSLYHMDLDPARSNGWIKVTGTLLHLSDIPAATTQPDLNTFFENAFQLPKEQLEYVWIDGTSTFVVITGSGEGGSVCEFEESTRTADGWLLQTHDGYLKAAKQTKLIASGSETLPTEQPATTVSASTSVKEGAVAIENSNDSVDSSKKQQATGGFQKALSSALLAPMKWLSTLSPGSKRTKSPSAVPGEEEECEKKKRIE